MIFSSSPPNLAAGNSKPGTNTSTRPVVIIHCLMWPSKLHSKLMRALSFIAW